MDEQPDDKAGSTAAATVMEVTIPFEESNDVLIAQSLQTVEQLVSLFGFSWEFANRAVNAIADKSDVNAAYNWCLDQGGMDQGGPVVPIEFCPHLRYCDSQSNFNFSLSQLRQCQHPVCASSRKAELANNDDEKSNDQQAENWICLAKDCRLILCSRYKCGHALQHYEATKLQSSHKSHCIAVSFADLSVWCYECEAYLKHNSLRPILNHLETIKFGTAPIPLQGNNCHTGVGCGYDVYKEGGHMYTCSPSRNAFERISSHSDLLQSCVCIGSCDAPREESYGGSDDGVCDLTEMICSGKIVNGVALYEDQRDPFVDVDSVVRASFYAHRRKNSQDESIARVLVVNTDLYFGPGKRTCLDDGNGDYPEILPLRVNEENSKGVRSIAMTMMNTSETSKQKLEIIKNWKPNMIFIRAGFWSGNEGNKSNVDNFLSSMQELDMATRSSTDGKIVVVLCSGGRPPMTIEEMNLSALGITVTLDYFVNFAKCNN